MLQSITSSQRLIINRGVRPCLLADVHRLNTVPLQFEGKYELLYANFRLCSSILSVKGSICSSIAQKLTTKVTDNRLPPGLSFATVHFLFNSWLFAAQCLPPASISDTICSYIRGEWVFATRYELASGVSNPTQLPLSSSRSSPVACLCSVIF